MLRTKNNPARCGSIMPLLAVSLVAVFGFAAMAIDVGCLAVATVECQNAADLAAVAGVRTLTTGTSANQAAATTNAQNAAIANPILGQALAASEIAVTHGAYHYDSSSQTFSPQFPPSGTDNYGLTKVTITHQVAGTFGRIFGMNFSTVTATAIAAYRPRDVAVVLDYSGSMNNESDIWNCETYLGSLENTPNNTDPVFPQFGPYNPTFSPKATLQCTSADPRVGMCNVTQAVLGIPAMANDFFQNNRGSSAASGFTPASNVCTAPTAGDNYLTASGNCVLTWSDAVNPNSSFFPGYSNFHGYTQGPGYWGKTFFIWPPQPSSDWRKLYFELTSGAPLNDNTQLWNSSGIWQNPSGNYIINYKAILNWIKNIGPNPFPPQLRGQHPLLQQHPQRRARGSLRPHPAQQQHQRRGWRHHRPAFLEGVHRLRHRGLARSHGEHPKPGHPDVQLRSGLHTGQWKSHPGLRPRLQVPVVLRGIH